MTHLLGKPLLRVFGQMRRILEVEPGWGLNIVPPPIPRSPQVRSSRHTDQVHLSNPLIHQGWGSGSAQSQILI